jgi:hypothetical protein
MMNRDPLRLFLLLCCNGSLIASASGKEAPQLLLTSHTKQKTLFLSAEVHQYVLGYPGMQLRLVQLTLFSVIELYSLYMTFRF